MWDANPKVLRTTTQFGVDSSLQDTTALNETCRIITANSLPLLYQVTGFGSSEDRRVCVQYLERFKQKFNGTPPTPA